MFNKGDRVIWTNTNPFCEADKVKGTIIELSGCRHKVKLDKKILWGIYEYDIMTCHVKSLTKIEEAEELDKIKAINLLNAYGLSEIAKLVEKS